MGDIDGAGFALLFAGQVVSGMAWAFLAMAAWAAAAPFDQDQTGGQNGGFGMKLFEAGQEMAADESGVFGDLDHRSGGRRGRFHDGYVILLIR